MILIRATSQILTIYPPGKSQANAMLWGPYWEALLIALTAYHCFCAVSWWGYHDAKQTDMMRIWSFERCPWVAGREPWRGERRVPGGLSTRRACSKRTKALLAQPSPNLSIENLSIEKWFQYRDLSQYLHRSAKQRLSNASF